MKIYIITLSGTKYTMNVNPDDKILIIKQMIKNNKHIPISEQRLKYIGNDLDNDNTFAFYGIQNYSTIHLVLKLPEYTHVYNDANTGSKYEVGFDVYGTIYTKCSLRISLPRI